MARRKFLLNQQHYFNSLRKLPPITRKGNVLKALRPNGFSHFFRAALPRYPVTPFRWAPEFFWIYAPRHEAAQVGFHDGTRAGFRRVDWCSWTDTARYTGGALGCPQARRKSTL